jgi:hypothetical protein
VELLTGRPPEEPNQLSAVRELVVAQAAAPARDADLQKDMQTLPAPVIGSRAL